MPRETTQIRDGKITDRVIHLPSYNAIAAAARKVQRTTFDPKYFVVMEDSDILLVSMRALAVDTNTYQFGVTVSGNKATILPGFILAQGLHRVDVGTDDGHGHKIFPTDMTLTAEYSIPSVRIPIDNIDGAEFFEINTRYPTLDQTYIYVPLVRLVCTDWNGATGTNWDFDEPGSIIHEGYIPLGNEVVFG